MNKKHLIFLLVVVLAALLPLFITNTYLVSIMVLTVIYCALSSAWNILSGFAGQFGFSGVFFALGAYICGGLFYTFNIIPWLGMLIAGVVVSIIAVAMGALTFPLQKIYFTIATSALLQILYLIFAQNNVIFGVNFRGNMGLHLRWIGGFWNMQFINNRGYYYIALIILIVILLFTSHLVNSRAGFYFKAVNTNQMAASSLGVNVLKYKHFAQILTAFMMSIIGGVYMMFITSIEPTSMFSFEIVFNIMLFALIGGRATIFGPTVGTVILMPLYAILRFWFSSSLPGLPTAMFGLALVLTTQFMPQGLLPLIAEKVRARKIRAMHTAGAPKVK